LTQHPGFVPAGQHMTPCRTIAAQNLLATDVPPALLHGKLHTCGEAATPLIVTYHPAYLLRTPSDERKAWEDLKFARATHARLAGGRGYCFRLPRGLSFAGRNCPSFIPWTRVQENCEPTRYGVNLLSLLPDFRPPATLPRPSAKKSHSPFSPKY